MTAATVHTHERNDVVDTHPHLSHALHITMDLPLAGWILLRWASRLTWSALRCVGRFFKCLVGSVVDFVEAHLEAVVASLATAVGLSLVTGIAVWMTLAGLHFWPLGVVMFGGGGFIVAVGLWIGGRK